jgi:cation transport regulator
MPYKKTDKLPKNIKSILPIKAQEIYLKVLNNALEEYKDEVVACKVAWSAVKRGYKKGASGNWIPK